MRWLSQNYSKYSKSMKRIDNLEKTGNINLFLKRRKV